jgi:hypothetical protein
LRRLLSSFLDPASLPTMFRLLYIRPGSDNGKMPNAHEFDSPRAWHSIPNKSKRASML